MHVLAPSFAATRFDEIAELYGLLDLEAWQVVRALPLVRPQKA